MRPIIGGVLILIALILASCGQVIEGQARVIDGDTLAIGPTRIRLYGIDAPELTQTCLDKNGAVWACGTVSRDALAAIVGLRPPYSSVVNLY